MSRSFESKEEMDSFYTKISSMSLMDYMYSFMRNPKKNISITKINFIFKILKIAV